MKTVSMILRLIAILGAAAAVAMFVMTKDKIGQLETKLTSAESQMKVAQDRAVELEESNEQLAVKSRGTDSELADKKEKIVKLTSQITQTRREISSLQQEHKKTKRELDDKVSENERLKEEIINKEVVLPEDSTSSEEVEEYQAQIEKLNKQVTRLKDELRNSQSSVPSVVESSEPAKSNGFASSPKTSTSAKRVTTVGTPVPQKPAAPPAPVSKGETATILKIDQKSGLMIVSLGQSKGFQNSMEFSIMKGFEKPIRLRIKNALAQYSVANILPDGGNPNKFVEGDVVDVLQ